MQETIGKRIARLRQQFGWTQQTLAERLAISRVAVSHLEMDLTIPGERTITLLAGLFKMTPCDLVDGSSYPQAKIERLPQITCTHTTLEVDLALFENDLDWLDRLGRQAGIEPMAYEVRQKWAVRFDEWAERTIDEHEKELLTAARQRIQS